MTTSPVPESAAPVRLDEPAGRWVLAITAVGSGLVLLEATVVNVVLPALERDLGASLALDRGFDIGMLICAGLFILGGVVFWFGVPRPEAVAAEPICHPHWTGCPQLDISRRPVATDADGAA